MNEMILVNFLCTHHSFMEFIFMQIEQILLSIEDTFKTMKDRQEVDAISMSQTTTELQLINQRLQNIENQMNRMEQTEMFNKHRFELFQDVCIRRIYLRIYVPYSKVKF